MKHSFRTKTSRRSYAWCLIILPHLRIGNEVETMFQAIFEAILRFLFEVVVRMTGEGILWLVTLGRRKFMTNTEALSIADLVGLLFWVAVGAGIYFLIA